MRWASGEFVLRSVGTEPATAGHIRFTGTLVPAAVLLAAAAITTLSIGFGQHSGLPIASWLVLLGLVLLEVRLTLSAAAAQLHGQETAATAQPGYFSSLVVLWLLGSASIAIGYREPANSPTPFGNLLVTAAILGAIGLVIALAAYYREARPQQLPQRDALANWCRATVWVALASGFLGMVSLTSGSGIEKSALQSLMLLMLLPTLEWLVRTLASEDDRVSLVSDTRLINSLFYRSNPATSVLNCLERQFAVDLRSTWAFVVARRSVLPMAIGLTFLGWLSTSIVTIGATEVGIQERFGSPVSRIALEPGIHLKAPWPIDQVHRVETSRVQSLTLGFAGPKKDTSLLWTKQHASEEYSLLLGDGRDFVTINALLQFTVDDPWVWHYGTQNPVQMLRVAAEQALLKNTANRSLNDVLSEQMSTLVHSIESDIRTAIDEYEIGAGIIGLTLQGLHPPVRVAEDYQAVVSAQHEREIAILNAQRYRTQAHFSANAQAVASISDAQAEEQLKTGIARGESEAFRLLEDAYERSPGAIAQHLRLNTIEAALRDRALVIIDDRIEKEGGILWFEE